MPISVFANNWELAFLKSAEEGKFPSKNVSDARVDLGTPCLGSGHATDRATEHGHQ